MRGEWKRGESKQKRERERAKGREEGKRRRGEIDLEFQRADYSATFFVSFIVFYHVLFQFSLFCCFGSFRVLLRTTGKGRCSQTVRCCQATMRPIRGSPFLVEAETGT